MTPPGAGNAVALQRRLETAPDPLDLYAALADGGRRSDTMLFAALGGRTLLMDRAAVRIECRNRRATLTALSFHGAHILDYLADELATHLEERTEDTLTLAFAPCAEADAEKRLRAPSPLDILRRLATLAVPAGDEDFSIALPGIFGFDFAASEEGLDDSQDDPHGFPDFVFWLADSLLLFEPGGRPLAICTAYGSDDAAAAGRAYHDAEARLARLIERCAAPPAFPAAPDGTGKTPLSVDLDDAAYGDIVERMREEIVRGEVYQIVPSRSFSVPCPDPLGAFARLCDLEPDSYRFFVAGDGFTLLGASPETSVLVEGRPGGKQVAIRPIAGTRRRGAQADDDDRLEAELLLDAKEAAEHMMLVDLARNDVARIARPGTRHLTALMRVVRYARLMHLVSEVRGELRDGLDALHAIAACLNMGTLSGAPKRRAMEILRATEATRRGPYGGAVGWLNGAGDVDSAVVIRSAYIAEGTAHVRVGAGVVYDSDPQAEADETRRKASALLSVLSGEGSK